MRKNDELLEKYKEIWDKVRNKIKKEFDREPDNNEKYLKTKIEYYKGKLNTIFHGDKLPKEVSQYICLSVIIIDFVFRTVKNYSPQIHLQRKKILKYITHNLEASSDESDKEDSDEENFNEENYIKEWLKNLSWVSSWGSNFENVFLRKHLYLKDDSQEE